MIVSSKIFSADSSARKIAADLQNITSVHIVGIGTSWHAALISQSFWKTYVLGEVHVHHSFEFAGEDNNHKRNK